jgi:hypothetical protein
VDFQPPGLLYQPRDRQAAMLEGLLRSADVILGLPSMAVLAARSCDVGQVGYEMALLVERVGAALSPAPRETVSH